MNQYEEVLKEFQVKLKELNAFLTKEYTRIINESSNPELIKETLIKFNGRLTSDRIEKVKRIFEIKYQRKLDKHSINYINKK